EWNDRYRDTVRSFWKGDGGVLGDLAYRITGSSDLYAHSGRRPYASVNFVTAHDGFTLEDLVSYNEKHNEANGEDNRDGNNNNRSWNCGVEGPTDDPDIQALRAKQKRNLLATLLLSQGVPMIYAGDAIGHTQMGNNNAYCQDNELSWLNWNFQPRDRDFLAFAQRMINLRRRHPVFRRRRFFQGRPIKGADVKDVLWLNPGGNEMSEEDWRNPLVQSLGTFLSGQGLDETDERGRKLSDTDFLVLLNPNHEDVAFILPAFRPTSRWMAWMDTSHESGLRPADTYDSGAAYPLQARSMVVLMERRGNGKKELKEEEPNEAPS
ncbi:MAG: glycogen debranching enzyme GlgX, partial [Candidatus Sulfotelmatobacter sp.]